MTSGVMNVIFPTGFDPTGATCTGCTVSGQTVTVTGQALTASTDQTLTMTGITNPQDAGGYGPFQIITRYYTGGQIIDINKNFASIYISETAGVLSNLGVSFASDGTTNSRVGTDNNHLLFTFELNQDLWKHDIFQITIDDDWTIGTNIECRSVKQSGIWNHFNSSDTNDIHDLNCVAETKVANTAQKVYVYGLANDIDLSLHDDYSKVKLKLNPMTNPNGKYAETQYNWTIETVRFQTRTVLESASTNGQPALTHGNIVSSSYYQSWGFDTQYLTTDHQTFMEIKFTTENYVDDGGSIDITVTDKVNNNGWGGNDDESTVDCYVVDKKTRDDGSTYTTCASNGTSGITISNLGSNTVNTSTEITIRVSVKFTVGGGTYAGISQILSKLADTTEVDKATTGLAQFQLADTVVNAPDTAITAGSTAHGNISVQAGGPKDTQGDSYYLKFQFKPVDNWDANTTGTFYAPLTSTELSESMYYVNTNTDQQIKISYDTNSATSLDCQSTTSNMETGGGDGFTTPTISDGTSTSIGYLQFQRGTTYTVTSNHYVTLCYHNVNANQPNGVPMVSSNAATRYEGWIDVSTTTSPGFTRYIGFTGPLSIIPRDTDTNTITTAGCSTGVSGGINVITVTLDKITIPGASTDREYYLDIVYQSATVSATAG